MELPYVGRVHSRSTTSREALRLAKAPWAALFALSLALAACQGGGGSPVPPPVDSVTVTISAPSALIGDRLTLTASSSGGSAFNWSVEPPDAGIFSNQGSSTTLFTAQAVPTNKVATITATLVSNPAAVGMATLTINPIPVPPSEPTNVVAASGGTQSAGNLKLDTVVLEPNAATTSRDPSGFYENRSGYYPSGNY